MTEPNREFGLKKSMIRRYRMTKTDKKKFWYLSLLMGSDKSLERY
jgi:hypothetical protein